MGRWGGVEGVRSEPASKSIRINEGADLSKAPGASSAAEGEANKGSSLKGDRSSVQVARLAEGKREADSLKDRSPREIK